MRQKARRDKKARFTALLHHVDVDRLREAYRVVNPRAATGVDEVTWEDYGVDLEDNLSGIFMPESRAAAIARGRPGGCISPSRTAAGGR